MSLLYGSEHAWRHMATVEIARDVADFAQLIEDDTLKFQVEAAGAAPDGAQRFFLCMDVAGGERRAARTAWAVLTALRRSADAGFIDGFRVTWGEHWLTLGDAAERAAPGPAEAAATQTSRSKSCAN